MVWFGQLISAIVPESGITRSVCLCVSVCVLKNPLDAVGVRMCVYLFCMKKQAYHETDNKMTVYKNERLKETVNDENKEQKDGRKVKIHNKGQTRK